MASDPTHSVNDTPAAIRRPGRLHSWMIAAIGVQFMLATVASASDISITAAERTRVWRISDSVVQVLRELADLHTKDADIEPNELGYRVVDSGVALGQDPHLMPRVRALSAMLTDLPPPSVIV